MSWRKRIWATSLPGSSASSSRIKPTFQIIRESCVAYLATLHWAVSTVAAGRRGIRAVLGVSGRQSPILLVPTRIRNGVYGWRTGEHIYGTP
jgi:hypothetical protein